MRRTLSLAALVVTTSLLIACGSTEPGPVRVIGGAADLVPLTGEWSGTFDSKATGRTGSITFHLTDDPQGAHGDVLMVPGRQIIHGRDPHPSQDPATGPHGMISGASVLSIEFVHIAGGEISGKIAPYSDPEVPEATLETHFTGRADGNWIEGTFLTYSDRGVSPRRGTWRVHRKSAR